MPKRHVWRLIIKAHLYAFGALAAFVLLAGVGGLAVWKFPRARRAVHGQVVRYYLRNVAPRLPFVIENLEVDDTWNDFLDGRLSNLTLDLNWSGWQIHLTGPIEIVFFKEEGERHLKALYHATVDAEPPEDLKKVPKIPPLPLEIGFTVAASFSHLDKLEIKTNLGNWGWKEAGLQVQDLAFDAMLDEGKAHVGLTAGTLRIEHEKPRQELELNSLKFSTEAPLSLSPVKLGPAIELALSASGGRTLWDEKMLKLPLGSFPLHGHAVLANGSDTLDLLIGNERAPSISISVATGASSVSLKWKTQDISLKELLAGVLTMTRSGDLGFGKISGKLATSGTARIALPFSPDPESTQVAAEIQLKKISFEWPEKTLAVSGLALDFPISTTNGVSGSVSIDKILYRKAEASLSPTQVRITPTDRERKLFTVKIGESGSPLPLTVKGIPLKIGSLAGTFKPASAAAARYDFSTSVKLTPTDAPSVARALCIKADHFPPSKISIDLPKIGLSPETIDPTGKISVSLFDGKLEISDIDLYNLKTEVPELDFDLDISGIHLNQIGDWVGFGEMDGLLNVSAHDVVFQAWLPTQYDFLFEVKPLQHTKVVFSPDAMKNFAELVAADSIEQLPGIAQWLAFGFPSRLLGGYDVSFAGISLSSHEGSILMETLTPEGLPDELALEQKQRHYVLYGNRFKIPLNTPHYPIVIDAPAVGNYLRRALLKFQKLKTAKEKTRHEEASMDCPPPRL